MMKRIKALGRRLKQLRRLPNTPVAASSPAAGSVRDTPAAAASHRNAVPRDGAGTGQRPVTLTQLPPDTLEAIAELLPEPRDVIALSHTSAALRQALRQPTGAALAQRVEERVFHMQDGDEILAFLKSRGPAQQLRGVTFLGLNQVSVTDKTFAAILACLRRHDCALEQFFSCHSGLGAKAAQTLASCGMPIQSLTMQHEPLGRAGAAHLFASPLPLENLALRCCHLGEDGLDDLPGSRLPLKKLDLAGNFLAEEYAERPTACQALAAARLPLESLNLDNTEIGDLSLAAIAASAMPLRSLSAYYNNISEEGLSALVASKHQLTKLNLRDNNISLGRTENLAQWQMPLQSLDLGLNYLYNAGPQALAQCKLPLQELIVYKSSIHAPGCAALAAAGWKLEYLDLSENPLGDEGAQAIASSALQVAELDLSHCKVGDAGAMALAGSSLPLQVLNLHANQIGDAGAEAFVGSSLPLTALDLLTFNDVGEPARSKLQAAMGDRLAPDRKSTGSSMRKHDY